MADVPDRVGLRAAESALGAYLAQDPAVQAAGWFVTTRSGLDPADGRPVLQIRSAAVPAAQAWVDARGGEWRGFRLRTVKQEGW
jgi:hypothetical protein